MPSAYGGCLLRKLHPPQEVLEAGVGAEGVIAGVDSHIGPNGLLLSCFFKPLERLVYFPKAYVDVCHETGDTLPVVQSRDKPSLHRFLDMVDTQHSAAYLETDVDGNVRQYEKFGVKVVAEEEVLGTVARVYRLVGVAPVLLRRVHKRPARR